MPRRPQPFHLTPKVGNLVLWASYASTPSEWQLARVLWVGDEDFLSQHSHGGHTFRQLMPLASIRAIGTMEQLLDVRRKAAVAVTAARKAVQDLETALGAARDDMWRAVDHAIEAVDAEGVQLAKGPPPRA